MKLFAHRANTIHIVNKGISATLPLSRFTALEPDYELPFGFIQREYQPKIMHTLIAEDGGPKNIDKNWEQGDRYLEKIADYHAIASEMTDAPPPPEASTMDLSLEEFKELKCRRLSSDCNATIIGGFTSNALGKVYHYDGGLEAQTNLIGALTLARQVQEDVPVTCTLVETGSKQPRPHSNTQLEGVFADGCNFKTAKIARYHELKAKILAATTKEAVAAINWEESP